MSGKKGFEQQIAALDAFRTSDKALRVAALHKALTHRNNFIVAKAADLVREFLIVELVPDLLTAFDRFFENPEKSDPQCWAKNSISRALAALEYQQPDVFLRGMRHIQLEPVYSGRSDSAGTLRATCALALVQCRRIAETDLLAHLVDLLADKDKSVRAEVVRAIQQVGSPAAALLLRLRAAIGQDEPEVLGARFSGVLSIEGFDAIAWVGRFLDAEDDTSAEAALAISGTHSSEGFELLRTSFQKASDSWFRSAVLSAIGLTRQQPAVEFLLDLVRTDSPDAERAVQILIRSTPTAEIIEQMRKVVAGHPRLKRAFEIDSENISTARSE